MTAPFAGKPLTSTHSYPKEKPIALTTKQKQSALDELRDLERKLQTASDEATTLGRQYQEAHRRLHGYMDERGLLYERGHLNERQPRLYEPDGTPKQSESAAGRLQAEIDKTPDLADLAQRAEHARRLERHAKQAVHAFVADKIDQVLDGLRPEGEVIAAGVNERLGKSVPELGNYLGFIQYVSSLVAAAGREPRTIKGLAEAAALKRTLERTELPAPIGQDA